MKISLKWLEDYVDVSDFYEKSADLAKKLTDVGLEVEEVESQSENFKNLVVGQITALGKHPDADKLTYCDVNVGEETLKIVCGAKNHKEGDKVCVAKIGAVLPGNFKIKKSKIRGVESFGMLCSASELGLEEKSEGILILDKDMPVGAHFAKAMGLDDVLFEINVTPNRADCLSHLGLAREISLIYKRPLKEKTRPTFEYGEGKEPFVIKIKDAELCPRYMGQMVYNVKVGPSPKWLQKRLESVGLKSINNVVDVTNYIMIDSGQPLHAFDADILKGSQISIATAKEGESFTTLDGTEIKLNGGELTIRDESGVLALAGLIGGLNSGVTESTKNVFIEAAHFIPSTVRKTARSLGIDTDSSYRFSRGTDLSRVNKSLSEAVALMADISGGKAGRAAVEDYPGASERAEIKITPDYVSQRLGFKVAHEKIEEIFRRLGFGVESSDKTWRVKPSSYRWDIEIKEDLVEEVGRIVGYSSIPEILPSFKSEPQNEKSHYKNFKKTRQNLTAMGYNEAVHYNFYSSAEEQKWSEEVNKWQALNLAPVDIQNPLGSDLSRMRTTLVPQFVSNYIRNWRLGAKKGKIFEIGKTHFKKEESFQENYVLTLGVWSEEGTYKKVLDTLMGDLENFFDLWNVKNWTFMQKDKTPEVFHPNLSAKIRVEGKDLGFIYGLNPTFSKEAKVSSHFFGLEINLDTFLKGQPRPNKFKTFSRQPLVERDFSVLLDKDFDFNSVYKNVKKISKNLLQDLKLVDQFEGEKTPEGKASFTFRGRFQSQDRTLSEAELKTLQEELLKGLAKI